MPLYIVVKSFSVLFLFLVQSLWVIWAGMQKGKLKCKKSTRNSADGCETRDHPKPGHCPEIKLASGLLTHYQTINREETRLFWNDFVLIILSLICVFSSNEKNPSLPTSSGIFHGASSSSSDCHHLILQSRGFPVNLESSHEKDTFNWKF